MEFYWKDGKDQLFVRTGTLPGESPGKWTTFRMPLREPSAMPVPFDFMRFLSSSITFMTSIQTVSLFLNDICLAKLVKQVKPSNPMPLPKGLSPRTKKGIMVVKGVNIIPVHIHADILDWVLLPEAGEGDGAIELPKDEDPLQPSAGYLHPASESPPYGISGPEVLMLVPSRTATSISLSVFSAIVSVRLDKKLSAEIHRCTKKSPPTQMRYDLVYTGHDEYNTIMEDGQRLPDPAQCVFQDLRADLEGQGTGRVIIGHATSQTTGIGGHMAARFIPTVERESIDFVADYIATWNKALLEVGGILSRIAYEYELVKIKKSWDEAARSPATVQPPEDIQMSLTRRALHALKFFTFHRSTPRGLFSRGIMEAFFACLATFPVMSSKGVKASFDVCLPEPALAGFLQDLAILPDAITTGATAMVEILKTKNYINHHVPDDLIIEQLAQAPLKEREMVACLKWWIGVIKNPQLRNGDPEKLRHFQDRLLSVAVLSLEVATNDKKNIALAAIKHFVPEASLILTDGPLPRSVLPSVLSREIPPKDLTSVFHWTELSVDQWVMHVSSVAGKPSMEPFDISLTSEWATQVLGVVSRGWAGLKDGARESIRDSLASITCIPTAVGMRKAGDAYLPNIIAFPDLPIVVIPPGVVGMDELLRYLGLKSRVPLDLVFDKLFQTDQWTTTVVVKYLASVRGTLTDEEIERLRNARVFPEATRTPDVSNLNMVHRVPFAMKELHEPLDICRKLELPILDWDPKSKWDSQSAEAELLREIGLKGLPDLEALIQGCASANVAVRQPALDYFLKNMSSTYSHYKSDDFLSIPYLPAIRSKQPIMGTPRDVVVTDYWGKIGFDVLDPDHLIYATALQVKSHPTPDELVDLLKRRPPEHDKEAAEVFSLMSPQTPVFTDDHRQTLSIVPFIPVKSATGDGFFSHLPPSKCYLGISSHPIYSRVFTFVDFGPKANPFLAFCGVKAEPTVDEIAAALAEQPEQIYHLSCGVDGYLAELRNLATKSADISEGTISQMKESPFLLAIGQRNRSGNSGEEECNPLAIVHYLEVAAQITVVGDMACYNLFERELMTAPQEDMLESFYLRLGARKLSKLVESECHTDGALPSSEGEAAIHTLIQERLPLFLHENRLAKPKLAGEWDSDLVVRAFRTLEITKTLQVGRRPWPSNRSARSAAAVRKGSVIELWICGSIRSMNALILDTPTANDDLLLSTILSTDIEILERRGYKVARILKRERERQQQQRHSSVEGHLLQTPPEIKPCSPRSDRRAILASRGVQLQAGSMLKQVRTAQLGTTTGPDRSHKHVQSLYSRLKHGLSSGTLSHSLFARNSPPAILPPVPAGLEADIYARIYQNLVSPSSTLTCTPGPSNPFREYEGQKSSVSGPYCDPSGRSYSLQLLDVLENVPVVAPQDAPPLAANTFIIDNRKSLLRFIRILLRLSHILQLPEGSIHVVNDPDESLVAFNRNPRIFLNFRYFEVHHDARVKRAECNSAYISWYFALAHEIAHNLVEAHNSEHEFYFTKVCDTHLIGLVELLL
ncbi:hypothetical protein BKA70DRAFT_1266345 [Coprinopsis sp. MPI-PUGE-AT-0042]|nr:hypothetical protein BKA70DRAFT_1266345 [Coprinopsis sp. MPI-PUGE-AT-0042]